MSSATVIARVGGCFWVKHVAMVLCMLCNVVSVEWLLLSPCSVVMCGMLFVIYGSLVFSSVLANLEISALCLLEVSICSCLVLEYI